MFTMRRGSTPKRVDGEQRDVAVQTVLDSETFGILRDSLNKEGFSRSNSYPNVHEINDSMVVSISFTGSKNAEASITCVLVDMSLVDGKATVDIVEENGVSKPTRIYRVDEEMNPHVQEVNLPLEE